MAAPAAAGAPPRLAPPWPRGGDGPPRPPRRRGGGLPKDALPFTLLLLSAGQLVAQGGSSSTVSNCAADGENCEASGCCKDVEKKCFQKDQYWSSCRVNCTPGVQQDDPADQQMPWSCKEIPRSEIPWKGGLKGTTFWDCNGAGCDSKVMQPFVSKLYIYAAPYAPADPGDKAQYGERLWLTGAASDTLAEMMGSDTGCCGSDADSGACGRCVLVRNPTAVNSNWTAVIMKKSRCPPESKGCEAGSVHMDIAVPGYENLEFSTANVCGLQKRDDTFISRREAGTCSDWQQLGVNSTDQGCSCHGIPNATVEQARLRNGCEVFTQWGWTSGDPALDYTIVDCPKGFVEMVEDAFGGQGPKSMEHVSYTAWIIGGVAAVVACASICIMNRILDRREAKKRYLTMQDMKRRKTLQQSSRTQSTASSSDTHSETASSSDSDTRE